jgi:CheY-like chemotaxis protein
MTAKKILIVDDEQDVCVYLSRLFQENGYAAMCAADGNEALAKVQAERPDLITLDLSMPNKSGVKFYREIKSQPELSGIPVVFVTGITGLGGDSGATERFYATRHQAPPPEGFVAKPIDAQEILGLVNRLIGL